MKCIARNIRFSAASFFPGLLGKNGTRNVTATAAIGAMCRVVCAFLLLALVPAMALSQTASPRIFFTDLDSGPNSGGQSNNGVFVTLYGNFFGATQGNSAVTVGGGTVASYAAWSNTKVTVQLGSSAASGNIVLTTTNGTSNGIVFTVRAGNIFFVSTSGSDSANGSFTTPWQTLIHARDTVGAGDTVYAMDGVAQSSDDGQGWNSCFTIGAIHGVQGGPIALVAYPGATATIGGVTACGDGIRAKGEGESYWTIAGFTLRGINTAIDPYGETGWRIIGNDMSCPNGGGQTACLLSQFGTKTFVYGNNIHHVATNFPPGSVTDQYHGVYISETNTNFDFGWNTIAFVQGCRGLQQNNNAGSNDYNIFIHDNIIHDTQCDGIVMTTIDPATGPVKIYNNLIYNAGQGPATAEGGGQFNCINLQNYDYANGAGGSGAAQVYNNTMYNCGTFASSGGSGMVFFNAAGADSVTMNLQNNIIYASPASPYCADANACARITGSNNIFFGHGAPPVTGGITGSINSDPMLTSLSTPDFHLLSGSPALDAGVTISGLATDFDGLTRPQGSAFSIGAYEIFGGGVVGPTKTLAASANPLPFGNVTVGMTSSLSTTITNTGTANVTISAAAITGTGMTITTQPTYPDILAPNATAMYTVQFAPAATGDVSGNLTITSDATNSPTVVALTGTGTAVGTVSASASATTVAAGGSTGSTITLTPANGFTGNVTVSCTTSSLPPGVTCSQPGPIAVPPGTGTIMVSVTAPSTVLTAQNLPPNGVEFASTRHTGERLRTTMALAGSGGIAFLFLSGLSGGNRRRSTLLAAIFCTTMFIWGCGGNSSYGGGHHGSVATTTTMTVSATKVPLVTGTLTINVQVSSATGTPTGSVQFYDGAAVLGAAQSLANGTVALSLTQANATIPVVGTHAISVRYLGDATHAVSQSGSLNITITGDTTVPITTTPASTNSVSIPLTIN